MVKLLKGDDEEKKKYLESLYFSLDYNAMLPLAITMFQKYREMFPDKLELLHDLYDQRKVCDSCSSVQIAINNIV